MFTEYPELDATEIANLIRKKEIHPHEVLDAAIKRIEKFNPKLNAVIYEMYDSAKKEIESLNLDTLDLNTPFAGVPFLVKDLGADIKGHPTSSGSRLTRNLKADCNSDIITRYKKSGLIILGKTNIPEFGIMGVTEPTLWGPCRNPWNHELTCGGSSGGSASAVAAGMVPMASADDGGGSIRIPASACGLFGFKPSRGLQPLGPLKNEGWLSLVSGHVVSKTVRDSALALDCTKGPASGSPYGPNKKIPNFVEALNQSLKGKKIAYSKTSLLGEKIAPECLLAQQKTLQACEDLGLEIIEDLPLFNKQEVLFSYYVIVASSVAGEIARIEKSLHKKASLKNIEPATWFLKIAGEKLRSTHLEQALYTTRQASLLWEQFLQKYDFFCTPTMGDLPSPIGLMKLTEIEKLMISLSDYLPLPIILSTLKKIGARGIEKTPNTCFFNMSGNPAMSVPTYWTNTNIPIGTQFVARMGEDDQLFTLASALENHFEWNKKFLKLNTL